MIRVSGELRNTLTHAVPKPRSTGTGDTRIAARPVPRTSAPTDAARVSLRIQRNRCTYTSRLAGSEKTFIVLLCESEAGRGRRGPPRPSVKRSGAVGQLADVQGGRRDAGLADGLVPGGLVGTVGRRGLEDVIDLVA